MGGSTSAPTLPPLPPPGTPLDVNEGKFGPNRDPDKDFPKHDNAKKGRYNGVSLGWYLFHPDSKEDNRLSLTKEREQVLATCKKVDKYMGLSEYEVQPQIERVTRGVQALQKEAKSTKITGAQIKAFRDGKLANDIAQTASSCKRLRDGWPSIEEEMNESFNVCKRNGFEGGIRDGQLVLDEDSNKTEECRKIFSRLLIMKTNIQQKLQTPQSGCQLIDLLEAMVNAGKGPRWKLFPGGFGSRQFQQ
eukprot:jgi/Bigna1/74467/fgenesh1_pg.29_\